MGQLHEIPLEVIATWPPPNYKNPVTRGRSLIVIDTLLPSISLIVVLLRCYTRTFIKKWFGLDDVFILLALLLDIALGAIVNISVVRWGWDRHIWDVPYEDASQSEKMAYIARIIYPTALVLVQLSLLCLYFRLLKDVDYRKYRLALITITAWVMLTYTISLFLNILTCIPISTYWQFPPVQNPHCLDDGKITMFGAVANNISDAFVTIFPIILVLRLNLPRPHMIITLCLLGFGFIASIASILRTYFLWKALYRTYDLSWMIYPLYTACAIEINLGIICASIPICRPIFDKTWTFISTKARSITSSRHTGNFASTHSRSITDSGICRQTSDMDNMSPVYPIQSITDDYDSIKRPNDLTDLYIKH